MNTEEVKIIVQYIKDCQDFEKALSAQGKELLQNLKKSNDKPKTPKKRATPRTYSAEQLKQAYNLKAKGISLKEVSKMTGINLIYLYNNHKKLEQRLEKLGVEVEVSNPLD